MPARIVLTSFGSLGDVYPYLALAQGLRARGHRPVLAMPAFYRERVERAGFDFHAVRPNVDPDDRALLARIMSRHRGTEVIVRELLAPVIRQSYEDLLEAVDGADLLVTHPITFAGPIVAERTGTRWASTVLAPISFFSAHELPVFPPAPWLSRIRALGPGVARWLIALAKTTTRHWTAHVRRFRRELGLAERGDPVYEGQFSPALVLGLFSRVLADPQPDWPPNTRVTGPLFYEQEESIPAALEAFLAAGDPPIVFTLGSSAVMAAGEFFDVSAEAARRAGRRAVLLAGPDARPHGLRSDVMAVEYAPHASVFPGAAAVVHQAGIGTSAEALRAGTPSLLVPFAHDQPDNAWRISRLGVARTLFPSRYTASRVAEELNVLLENPAYGARARDVAAAVRAERGVDVACEALEELLGRS